MKRVSRIQYGCVVALVWAAPAFAQATTADAPTDDIIVTATRRETSLQKTPAAISVVTSESIEKRHLVRMEDYLASVPGVAYQDRGAGSNTITIRGIGFGNQLDANTPTGSYFGEVPITGLGPALNGNQAGNADVQMIDIARVEVLRGPQGTLFGSGSLGGTLRVIPNAPNLTKVEGSVSAEYSSTSRLGGSNYQIQGVVNVPIVEDRLAVRVVGYKIHNDGYINNVAASQPTAAINAAKALGVVTRDRKHVGGDTTAGFRGAALWQPVEGLSVSLMHLYQQIKQDGRPEVETTVSPTGYLQVRPQVGAPGDPTDEYVNSRLNITNLILQYDWEWGSLLNSSSRVDSRAKSEIALSFLGAPFVGTSAGPNKNHKKVWINETRFASKWGGPLQLIAGFYYEDRTVDSSTTIRWSGTGSPPAGTLTNNPLTQNKQRQYAAFGEVAFTPWDPFTLTVGARYYNFKQSIPIALLSRTVSPTLPSNISAQQGRRATVDGVNWKVNAQYKLSSELFVYGQFAQGFREPRFQTLLDPQFDQDGDGLYEFRDGSERLPPAGLLDPDRVKTYEGGIKFQSNSGKLRGSLTAFYTDWTGIPVSILTVFGGAAYFFNAGAATSKGVEFELSGELPGRFYAQFSASWIKAQLGSDAQSRSLAGGKANAELPGSPDHNLYLALEKRFDIGSNEAFVRGDWTYLSDYVSAINQTGLAGDYSLFGASAGITIDKFKVGVFVKNLTNRDDFTWIDNTLGSGRAYRLRPRTIGINVGANF